MGVVGSECVAIIGREIQVEKPRSLRGKTRNVLKSPYDCHREAARFSTGQTFRVKPFFRDYRHRNQANRKNIPC